MINVILVIIVCIALVLSLITGIYALFQNLCSKKKYFLLMQVTIVIYLFGYLLELTSSNAGEAFAAVRVLYVGSYFVPVFALFFVADYCDIKLSKFIVKIPMLILSLAIVLITWTTKYHGLIYQDYSFGGSVINHLFFTPGPLYSIISFYPFLCMIIIIFMLIQQIKKTDKKYRRQLFIILLCVIIPILANGIYVISVITGLNKLQIYFTPHSLAIMSFCLYLGVVRFNLFEVISTATLTAMEHIREGIIFIDGDDGYLSSNRAAAKMLPGITKLLKGESIFNTKNWPGELSKIENGAVEIAIKNGSTRYYTASISPSAAENRNLNSKMMLFTDITDNVNLMKELENSAYIDSLTCIYNRKHFNELARVEIERALRSAQPIYVAMLDLDYFKNINDTYGHAAGDQVLRSSAEIIQHTIRSYDLLCRYGGEEFVLMITALDETEAYRLVERIRENIETCVICYESIDLNITCSIGIARFMEADTLETALKKADDSLYAAKNAGRNFVKMYGK